ncbi:hypothetical protein Pelo_19887 [Pelomyxa schiedti]|nr:hypothetical protein Pelo_19887 [Pelomyxa schiedti]
MTLLGDELCLDGTGGELKDANKAISLWESAASQGDTTAMCMLAFFYEEGYCVSKDALKAGSFYQMAADSGDPRAMCCLGARFGKDTAEAVALWQRASDAGNNLAMAILGMYYFNGDGGIEKDHKKAASLFQKALL